MLVAGASSMRWRAAILANLAGTFVYVVAIVATGSALFG
jgi:hypothetical protein